MLLLAVIGLASCSEEYAQPPVITPEGGQIGRASCRERV